MHPPCLRNIFGLAAAALAFSAGTALAQPDESDIFREDDSRRITAYACTRDSHPVEGRLYLVTSFSDAQRLNKTIASAELQQSLDGMWREILHGLTYKDIFAPERAKFAHEFMSKYVDALEKKIEEETGISLSIYQIESRPLDPLTELEAPSCGFDI